MPLLPNMSLLSSAGQETLFFFFSFFLFLNNVIIHIYSDTRTYVSQGLSICGILIKFKIWISLSANNLLGLRLPAKLESYTICMEGAFFIGPKFTRHGWWYKFWIELTLKKSVYKEMVQKLIYTWLRLDLTHAEYKNRNRWIHNVTLPWKNFWS
jgi:hypothetical protein